MDLREAAQQALDALEYIYTETTEYESLIIDEAIAALRAALADTQDWNEIEALRASLREHMAEIHRLNECLTWEQHRAEHVGTHGPGCAEWGAKHYECLLRAHEALKMRIESTKMVEPVEYMSMCFSNGQTKPHSKTLFWPEQYTGRTEPVDAGAWGEERVVPLYISPTKREPLTAPQIHELDWPDDVAFEDILKFVRAIERAHGIGDEE